MADQNGIPDALNLKQVDYDPFAAEKFANPAVQGAITSLATLPRRVIENSQQSLDSGNYDPRPTLEAATLPMGTGAIAGVPVRAGEAVLGSGAVRGVESGMGKTPQELYHVVGEDYKPGDPLRSLFSRKGNAAYDEYAERWPEAGDLAQYHPHQNFFYDKLADAEDHATDFGGKILKVNPKKVGGLNFDKNEGFWTTRDDVPPDALSPFAQANSVTAGIGPAATPTIRAYHGSPHDFDAFDMSKIGTGEGAQAYGHGLYFAENEGTAKAYRDDLAGSTIDGKPFNPASPIHQAAARIEEQGNRAAAIKETERRIAADPGDDMHPRVLSMLLHRPEIPPIQSAGGKMYEININADPVHFLDYGKPLSEQHPIVQEAIAKHGLAPKEQDLGSFGEQLITGAPRWADTAEEAAKLRAAGIPGIKYLDQGSRAAGYGSRNYVVFDDNLINIVKKYGLAGISMLPPSAAAFLGQRIAPIDHNPYAQGGNPAMTPVDHDPFEGKI